MTADQTEPRLLRTPAYDDCTGASLSEGSDERERERKGGGGQERREEKRDEEKEVKG